MLGEMDLLNLFPDIPFFYGTYSSVQPRRIIQMQLLLLGPADRLCLMSITMIEVLVTEIYKILARLGQCQPIIWCRVRVSLWSCRYPMNA